MSKPFAILRTRRRELPVATDACAATRRNPESRRTAAGGHRRGLGAFRRRVGERGGAGAPDDCVDAAPRQLGGDCRCRANCMAYAATSRRATTRRGDWHHARHRRYIPKPWPSLTADWLGHSLISDRDTGPADPERTKRLGGRRTDPSPTSARGSRQVRTVLQPRHAVVPAALPLLIRAQR